jgi:hypothetical protein
MAAVLAKIAQLETSHKIQQTKQSFSHKLEFMKRDVALEIERRDRQAEKKEMLMQTALENERRERQAEKKEMLMQTALENERRDRQAEKMMAALENEKRDRQAEKRETIAAQEKKEMLTALENQKRDHQSQINQLKWETRVSQMEQQLLAARAQNIQPINTGIPGQYTTNATNGTPQQQVELLRQHNQMLEVRMRENEIKQLASGTPLVGALSVQQQQQSMLTPAAVPSEALALTALPSATKQQAPSKAQQAPPTGPKPKLQLKPQLKPQSTAPTSGNVPSALLQQQRQVVTRPAKGRSVLLPDDAHTHFFLSHCQASGGDQTNAIYLELRQLGFLCW